MNLIVKRKAPCRFQSVIMALLVLPISASAQSDLTAIVRGSEILVGGLITIFAKSKDNAVSKTVESVCIKNKMGEKITIIITQQSDDGDEIKKELVIPEDSKECFYDLPKGVYSYEILLANDEVYKKGEYRFKKQTVITLKKETNDVPEITNPNTSTAQEEVEEEDETKTPTG